MKIKNIKLFISLLATSIPFFGNTQVAENAELKNIKEISEQVRKTYAPDKRTALFEFKTDEKNPQLHHIETTIPAAKEEFLKATAGKFSGHEFKFNVLPNETVGDKKKGVIRLSVVDIRYTPANQAEMVTQGLLGTPVDLLKKQGDYYLIRTPEGYIAWLKGASLTAMDDAKYQSWKNAKKVMYTADYGNVYSAANLESQRVSDIVLGNILVLNEEVGDFYGVKFPDGRSGFVHKKDAVPYEDWLNSNKLHAENVLQVAKSMIGVPYLWGGTSIKGVDCSGLTKTAYFMSGLVIPRDASQQVNSGKEIDILTNNEVDKAKVLANLKPADLLFFAERKGQIENPRVTHVAIYMGNGEFIHASGLVRINSLFHEAENYDNHQAKTLVGARRYIGETGKELVPVKQHDSYAK